MLLTLDQIRFLIERTKWTPVYEDHHVVLCTKDGIGYSADPQIGAIQAALSIMGEVEAKRERAKV
jgi:hypothetical protein